MPTQLLIDGHSLLFRAYHALPPLTTASGIATGALHGFASMLFRVTEQEHPDRLVVVFDVPEITFRHEQFREYKAQREETPDDFRRQLPLVKELLDLLGIPVLAIKGYEADDTLGTLAVLGRDRGYHTFIVTGDRDLLQLVEDKITVLLTSRTGISDLDRMDRSRVKEKMGVWPEQIPDLKGLMGDGSDNIPGVSGIGQKSALALIETYDSVENLLVHVAEISNTRWQRALTGHELEARRFRDLATIVTEVPLEWPEVAEPFHWDIHPGLTEFLDRLELHAVRRRLGIAPTPLKSSHETGGEPLPEAQLSTEESFTWDDQAFYVCYPEPTALWIDNPSSHTVVRREPDEYPLSPTALAGWGIKEIYCQALEEQKPLPHFIADAKIEAYLLDSERRDYSLESLCRNLGIKAPQRDSSEGVIALSEVLARQAERLRKAHMEALYREVELPLARVLAHMQASGVLVDRSRLEALGVELKESLSGIEQEIYRHAGETFNINSGKKLAEILFERLGLPSMKRTKTGYSTDAETLESLFPLHPIVGHILTYRQLMKIQGTYVDGLLPLIRADGRIHTTFHQTVTATGRLSSSDPNLQNIPVRLPLGRRVRGVFVPSPGRTLIAADYSQIELRILAHLAQDTNLIQAFVDGEDIHRRTASEIFNIPMEAVDSLWRSRAKAVNFGIIYGISDFGLARDTGVSRSEAKDYIARYYERYPDLKRYFDAVIEGARRDGYVKTILGRRRPLPEISSKNHVRRQYAERMAMNTAIQGSAADLIKVAMVRIFDSMAEARLMSTMILQVHDELIWDARPDERERLITLADHHMAGAISLSVPLVVEFKEGPTWEAMTPRETPYHHA